MDSEEKEKEDKLLEYDPEQQKCRNISYDIASGLCDDDNPKLREGGW